ncbi:hypothetical protein [Ascidiimonas sp. W6]|uniref:hypothetical protein n=1 Tax=Ascidiimonas meishanensis TaxID=3128903 RepID=UPI0030ED6877
MEIQKQTGFQKFLSKSKDVISFTLFLVLKALKLSEKKETNKEPVKTKLTYKEVAPFFKEAYVSIKKGMNEGVKEVQELKKQKKKKKYKTGARIKQDFKEWYGALREEFNSLRNRKQMQLAAKKTEEEENKSN